MSDLFKQFGPFLVFLVIVAAGVWGIRRYLRRQRRLHFERDSRPFTGSGGGRASSSGDRYPRRKE